MSPHFFNMVQGNLALEIYRQRLVIEGYCQEKVTSEKICHYLNSLGKELGMKVLLEPMTNKSSKYGWAGWVHWESSGTHVYAWDEPKPLRVKEFPPQSKVIPVVTTLKHFPEERRSLFKVTFLVTFLVVPPQAIFPISVRGWKSPPVVFPELL